MQVILKIEQGPEQGRTFEFNAPDTFLVGRTREAHFTLSPKDLYVSRRHFILEVVPPYCFLKDFGSKNGTFVNGQRVQDKMALKDNDVINAGDTYIKVIIAEPEPETLVWEEEEAETMLKVMDETERETIIKTPAACSECQQDLSAIANADGNAESLLGTAQYLCLDCAIRRKQQTDIDNVGDYLVLSELGRGGMGVVYQSVHKPTGRLVALKKIKMDHANEVVKGRFAREMRLMSNLVHPNVVRLFDSGLHNGDNFLITELLAGGDAYQMMSKEFDGPVPPKTACKIALDILGALDYFHGQNNVHRDIKPGNMLLVGGPTQAPPTAKLTDFGLSKCYADAGGASITGAKEVSGTVLFMAPEQILNFKNTPPSADVYSVGVSLYELLTTQYPFDFPSKYERFQAKADGKPLKDPILIVLEDQPVPILQRNASLPSDLAVIVDKSIQKKIVDRFSTANEFKTALDRIYQGL